MWQEGLYKFLPICPKHLADLSKVYNKASILTATFMTLSLQLGSVPSRVSLAEHCSSRSTSLSLERSSKHHGACHLDFLLASYSLAASESGTCRPACLRTAHRSPRPHHESD
ncbi:hypothetical protein AcV7_003967 [Taiwanofungus camphoratus]|nr:hypothetical protein AcV7_003967 [Antrodia cinnamomea]